MKSSNEGPIRRFTLYRIIEHQVNAVVFILLVITGMAQSFHDYRLSQWVIHTLGGVDTARMIHRICGFSFTVIVAVHVAVGIAGMIIRKWPASMVVNAKDFTDAIENLKYYFGVTNHPALCDRYDYKQKFEYWGVIAGGMLMIMTGFVLWFPVEAARFLPGEVIPAAKAAHSNEALMAFLVIITWHIYDAVFSPEVFPLDTSIFTGSISRERMVHEHPLELARIEGVPVEEIVRQAHAAGHGARGDAKPRQG